MQHILNPDGTRNRDFRPYIYGEETTYSTSLYDPFRSVDYGLYTRGVQPGAIPAQLDVLRYEQMVNNRTDYNPQEYRQPAPRHVYTAHNSSSGKTTMYKHLYAI